MKKPVFIAITASVAIALTSCNKNSDTPDTEEGNWVKRGYFDGPARYGAVSFVINDTAYVGTGYNASEPDNYVDENSNLLVKNHYLRDFFKLTMPAVSTSNSQTGYYWTQVACMPDDGFRANGTAFTVHNIAYVGLGSYRAEAGGAELFRKDFYSFDGSTWQPIAPFKGSARKLAVGFGLGSKGYVTTGWDGANNQKDCYQYDPVQDSWTLIDAIPGDKRQGASVFVYKDKVYLFGGAGSATACTDMWQMDSVNLKWTALANITNTSEMSYDDDYSDIVRENAAAFVIDNYGYYSSGDNGGTLVKSTWRYDFEHDRWLRRTPLERNDRNYAVGFTVHNRGFLGTGLYGSTPLDDFQEFIPSQTYNAND